MLEIIEEDGVDLNIEGLIEKRSLWEFQEALVSVRHLHDQSTGDTQAPAFAGVFILALLTCDQAHLPLFRCASYLCILLYSGRAHSMVVSSLSVAGLAGTAEPGVRREKPRKLSVLCGEKLTRLTWQHFPGRLPVFHLARDLLHACWPRQLLGIF